MIYVAFFNDKECESIKNFKLSLFTGNYSFKVIK